MHAIVMPRSRPPHAGAARSAAVAPRLRCCRRRRRAAMTSHAGWPPDQHLVMDTRPRRAQHVLVGRPDVHNYLLGGYGNDTIYGGDAAT